MSRWLQRLFMLPLLLVAPFATGQFCSISVPTMNLGTYTGTILTPGATPMTVSCIVSLSYTASLNAGTGVSATTTTRKMTGPGGATLNYQMFQNSSRTINWGNTSGTDTVSGTAPSGGQTVNIYPEVAAGQIVTPGVYTDTITASMTAFLFGTFTTTFTVTATVPASCIVSASALNFGTYSGVLINASSILTVTCTNTTVFNIGLSAGNATGATVTNRKMTGPGSVTLNYKLFRDSLRTQNWGITVGTDTLLSAGNGGPLQYTVFGQLPAGQVVNPGVYSDTIIATITY